MWTREALHDLIDTKLRGYQLIVVSNREPYIHRLARSGIECIQPASGMANAIEPIVRACGGVWVAHGGGDADRRMTDERGHVRVPPRDPRYVLRRVWLTKEEEEKYYYGMSNEGIWPLCHITFTRPTFEPGDWETYREVNRKFARAVLEEAEGKPSFVFIQDYHFGLLPRYLKEADPNLIVAQFWHIPWPNIETFRVFPWIDEMLDGLLGNDLLGFHLRYHCQNFLETVDRSIETRIDRERWEITRGGKSTLVRPFPISLDFDEHSTAAAGPEVSAEMDRFREELGLDERIVGLAIERIDYTKGIPERLGALDRFFERNPAYRERVTFVQVGVPSRTRIEAYHRLDDRINGLVEEINWKYGTDTWRPIIYSKRHHSKQEMMALHRLADLCIVSSLHDGMNLVAKEFVSSRVDEQGVLILSRFTGAARELTDALLVNPFSMDETAGAIHAAIEMPEDERRRRMQRLRSAVSGNNIYRWAGKVLNALLKLEARSVKEIED
jgi:trehalose 6-phosphate synthase